MSRFVPSLWLPTATNTYHNIPEISNLYPKIPIKTAFSQRQQGFEFPRDASLLTQVKLQKQPSAIWVGGFFGKSLQNHYKLSQQLIDEVRRIIVLEARVNSLGC